MMNFRSTKRKCFGTSLFFRPKTGSAEIFVNDGEHVMTATIYTDLEADGISFFADGKVEMDVTKYELKL